MTIKTKHTLAALAVLALMPLAANAEGTMAGMPGMTGMSGMPGMNGMHGMHDMSAHAQAETPPQADAAAAPAAPMEMDHSSGHQQMEAPSASHAEHGSMPVQPMQGMQMPAAPAPAPAPAPGAQADPAQPRDPNGYADGYTLSSGPYALAGRRLHLGDEHSFGMLLADRLERGFGRDSNSNAYDVQAWFGRSYDRLVLKAEGDVAAGKLQEARTELLWGHAIANYWDAQLGVRADSGGGNGRGWLAAGVQGLAPYWFEVDATAYVGDGGRTALRLAAEYEILLTQRLILQPRAEVNLYGKRDPDRAIGSGLSDAVAGLRLRYEVNRQFAPYVGVEWSGKYGETADFARADGERSSDLRVVAGARLWF